MSPTSPGSLTRMPATQHGLDQSRSQLPRPRALVVGVVAALVPLAMISACGGSDVHAQSGPTSSPIATSQTSPPTQPTTANPREQAGIDALAQVVAYEHTLDALAIDRHLSLDRLYRVSTQPDVTNEIAFLNHFRSSGDQQRGLSRVTGTRIDDVSLPRSGGVQIARARVSICLDVAQVRAVNRKDKSIVNKTRKPYYLTRLVLINTTYPKAADWLVKHVTATEERSCSV